MIFLSFFLFLFVAWPPASAAVEWRGCGIGSWRGRRRRSKARGAAGHAVIWGGLDPAGVVLGLGVRRPWTEQAPAAAAAVPAGMGRWCTSAGKGTMWAPTSRFFSSSLPTSFSLSLSSPRFLGVCVDLCVSWGGALELTFFFSFRDQDFVELWECSDYFVELVLLIATYSAVYLVIFVLGNVDCRTCMVSLLVRRTRNMST